MISVSEVECVDDKGEPAIYDKTTKLKRKLVFKLEKAYLLFMISYLFTSDTL